MRIEHFYRFKNEFTQKIANNRKFTSQWLILSAKMIHQWAPFAMQCYAGKNRTKNGHFPPLCNVQVFHEDKKCRYNCLSSQKNTLCSLR